MLGKKIILNDAIRDSITRFRKSKMKEHPELTADGISEKIGRSKSWLSQVENGRLKSVKNEDFVKVYCVLYGADFNFKYEYDAVAKRVDNEIMLINAFIKHGIADENGNILDFHESLRLEQCRGFLRQAGKMTDCYIKEYLQNPIQEIEKKIKTEIHNVLIEIVRWINRAFDDTADLFSDEVSTKNLYCLLETAYTIFNAHCDYFGLNPLTATDTDLKTLKNKLNTDCFIKPRTVLKPLDDYTESEFKEVVKNFSSEEYMQWKNKRIYIGDDPFPMTVGFIDSKKERHTPLHYITYPDLNKATGLSEKEYLYIIKQVYLQFDIFYKDCQSLRDDLEFYKDENDQYYDEIQELNERINELTNKLNTESEKPPEE